MMLSPHDEEHYDQGGRSPDMLVAASGSLAAFVAVAGGRGRDGYTFDFAPQLISATGFQHIIASPASNRGHSGMDIMGNLCASGIAGPANSIFQENGNKKSNDGIVYCTVYLPGLPQPFDVPFPSRKLPVCLQCKKNYRSRELCRQRDDHRALPWRTVYPVVTLTEEVLLEMNYNGNVTGVVANIPVTAVMQEDPVMCDGPLNKDDFMSKQPICKGYKKKCYTRNHCREILKHTTPPH